MAAPCDESAPQQSWRYVRADPGAPAGARLLLKPDEPFLRHSRNGNAPHQPAVPLLDNNTLCLVADLTLLAVGPCAPISAPQQWRAGAAHGTIESVGESAAHNGKAICLTAGPAADRSANATLSVDLRARGRQLNHVWKAAVGSSHAATTLRGDWQARHRP